MTFKTLDESCFLKFGVSNIKYLPFDTLDFLKFGVSNIKYLSFDTLDN